MENLEWLEKHLRNGSPPKNLIDSSSNSPSGSDPSVTRESRAILSLLWNFAEKVIEELKLAEERIYELEKQQREGEAHLNDARAKLQRAGEVLENERARMVAAENRMAELEKRAKSAEERAEECNKTVARIEDAIRTEISRHASPAPSRLNAAA